MTDPQTIVEGMTRAQRAMILGAYEDAIGGCWVLFLRNGPSSKIIGNLCAKGLSEPHRINIQRLTKLGLAVRTHLEKESKK